MGTFIGLQVDDWLRDGGMVVTSSDRAARALRSVFHRARLTEELAAWPEPRIQDWNAFLREQWLVHAQDERLLLNAAQEEALWSDIVVGGHHPATTLDGPRHRVAALAMEAHDLLASYAPRYLRAAERGAWRQDSSAFSSWLAHFSHACREKNLLSASRLPLELVALLRNSDPDKRPSLLLAGFDRIQPAQRELLEAWGRWSEVARGDLAANVRFYSAPDSQSELAACALWCRSRMEANPDARLLIVTQEIATRRGEMERELLRRLPSSAEPVFEFTLGIPLGQVSLVKSAQLLLRWLNGPLGEEELDWLFSSGQAVAAASETAALQRTMRALRSHGEARSQWTLDAFCSQRQSRAILPPQWIERMNEAQQRLASAASRPRTAIDWAELIPNLLRIAGWPGFHSVASTEFQVAQKWQQALESCASLGFDGRRMTWQEFFSALARVVDKTLFAPESRDARIQIAGPAESAGLSAEGIWFLNADEDAWPNAGSTHPLVPLAVQRESGMPHASPKLDWDLGQAVTTRLLASATEVCFSYARQRQGTEARPSRLVSKLVAEPEPLPPGFIAPPEPNPVTVAFNDASSIPFSPGPIRSGADVLTYQSQCPFMAFAIARLDARGWEAAEAGLTAAQRGQLLHAALRSIWGEGPPGGIRSRDDLLHLDDRRAFVAGHVQRVLRREIPDGVRECVPQSYLELEQTRLSRLLCEWLDYEATRMNFTVADAESNRPIEIEGLVFNVRLDRVDRLNDGSLLVIDYKSGYVSPALWDLPRPENVQLPLYASFALGQGEEVGGLAFAKLRAGDLEFAGRVRNAAATLNGGLSSRSDLAKKPLTSQQLDGWKRCIEQLARDFIAGRAEADPRDFPRTCERCELPVLCRIRESRALLQVAGASGEAAGDE